MRGDFIDILRCRFKKRPASPEDLFSLISTDFGQVRVFDTKGDKPVILSVPDGPNVIEHHQDLISKLSKNFRVICFELSGLGQSYPNSKYDYSFDKAALLIINVMDILRVERATLCFSCSNGFYAIRTAELFPERIGHLFLSQTPSIPSVVEWANGNIPKILRYPVLGQVVNSFSEKRLARIWYRYALPKETDNTKYIETALYSLDHGGCFCLSGLVQGLDKERNSNLKVIETPATVVWGTKDYTHRKTDRMSILEHLPKCEIIEFETCGHFPELEDTDRYAQLLREKLSF